MSEGHENLPPPSRSWYRVSTRTPHMGTGYEGSHTNYCFAKDAVEALDQAKRMKGVKIQKKKDVSASPLKSEEIQILKDIITELKVPYDLAKKHGLYGQRGNFDIEDLLQERLASKRK